MIADITGVDFLGGNMNILVITQLYPEPDDTGDNKPTRTVEYFAKEWVAAGHSVYVMHCSSKFPLALYLIPEPIKNKFGGASSNIIPSIESRKELKREALGIRIRRIPMLKLMPGMGYSDSTFSHVCKKIENYLEAENFRPDLVVGHFANPSTQITAILAEHYGAKSSIVFHHDCNERNIKRYRLDKWVKQIGAIGARSLLEQKQIKQLLHLKKDPFLCYSGVPNDAVQSAAKTCDKMDFSSGTKYLYVGSLIKRKHLESVMDAFDAVMHEGDQLLVVGGGPNEETLKEHREGLKHKDSVVFVGRVPREEVLNKMKEAQVFTLISDGETYGMVYAEAMLQGCIVIASVGGGFDGIIKNGINGFLCNPGDADMLMQIYRQIQSLTSAQRNEIGKKAIETVAHMSEREVAEDYLKQVLEMQD